MAKGEALKKDRNQPLTRKDVETLLKNLPNSKFLDLSSRNLSKIDLSYLNLREANLSKANLSNANLQGVYLLGARLTFTDLSGANLIEADLSFATLLGTNLSNADLTGADLTGADLTATDLKRANLSHATLIGVYLGNANTDSMILSEEIQPEDKDALFTLSPVHYLLNPKDESTNSVNELIEIGVRIMEEPFTAFNFSSILTSIIDLHTKLWLIQQGRFSDLIYFAQVRDNRLIEEAGLAISKMSHNSPGEISFPVGKELGETIAGGIDAVYLTKDRKKGAQLKNQSSLTDIESKQADLESKIKIIDSNLSTDALDRRIKAENAEEDLADRRQKREIELEKAKLELEKQKIEIEHERLKIQKEQLEIERENLRVMKERYDTVLEISETMVQKLFPDADHSTKRMAAQTIANSLLQLGEAKAMQLLPIPPAKKD